MPEYMNNLQDLDSKSVKTVLCHKIRKWACQKWLSGEMVLVPLASEPDQKERKSPKIFGRSGGGVVRAMVGTNPSIHDC